MQINEAIGLLDKYFYSGVSDESVAWEVVREELSQVKKLHTQKNNGNLSVIAKLRQ